MVRCLIVVNEMTIWYSIAAPNIPEGACPGKPPGAAMAASQEYLWSRPGCFKCKEPIGNRDYIEIRWVGKTWGVSYNVCEYCWEDAGRVLDLPGAGQASPRDPAHGRNVAV
jgi:hypothetical protein